MRGATLVFSAALLAQLGAQDQPAATPPAPVPLAECESLLTALDDCFNRGDAAAYLQQFRPDHTALHALLVNRLPRCATGALQRRSAVLGPARAVGPRTVLSVRHDYRRTGQDQVLASEHSFLVLARAAGKPVAVQQIETYSAAEPDADLQTFGCKACNYALGSPGWLCVPLHAARVQAVEGIEFLLLGSDLACEVTVHVDQPPLAAAVALERCIAAVREAVPDSRPGPLQPWLPRDLDESIAGLAGGQREIGLPDGQAVQLFTVTLAGLRHVLAFRGSAAALRARQAECRALLDSFRLLRTDGDLTQLCALPVQHHQGGRFRGITYENERYGVAIDGPSLQGECTPAQGALFQARWQCNEQRGSATITGLGAPVGLAGWCEASADQQIARVLAQNGLRAVAADDSGWGEPNGCGFSLRRLRVEPLKPAAGAEPAPRHWFCFGRRGALLVVIEARLHEAAAEPHLLELFTTLRGH